MVAQIWEKKLVIAFYKGVSDTFGVYTNEFVTNTQGNNLRVRHFGSIYILKHTGEQNADIVCRKNSLYLICKVKQK